MSSGLSSDQIIKQEIKEKLGSSLGDIRLRIFPESSRDDQVLFEEGGLTFSHEGKDYGSCDAVWCRVVETSHGTSYIPLIGLEGTDALQRGSSGDAQYQRFHHALGAVKKGFIGVYYLREGACSLQLDLYEMAYQASKAEKGYYLIIQDLNVLHDLLVLINNYGEQSKQVHDYCDIYLEKTHEKWFNEKFEKQYHGCWDHFAERRSMILLEDYNIKYTGRCKRNFTDGSQRAGHIAVGEMFLSKYYFPQKKLYYLCPRMSKKDVVDLDKTKKTDKEWNILRTEENVFIKTRDHLINLPSSLYNEFESLKDVPLKGDYLRRFNCAIDSTVKLIKAGTVIIDEYD